MARFPTRSPERGAEGGAAQRAELQLRYNLLTELLLGRFEEFADHLGIEVLANSFSFFGPCPVHGGDRPSALNIYRGGDVPGKWMCFTHHCEGHFKKSLLGLVRGVLSAQRLGWNTGSGSQRVYGWQETVLYCCDFLGVAWDDLKIDSGEVARQRLLRDVGGWGAGAADAAPRNALCPRRRLEESLALPSPYFCGRGHPGEILKRFGVGDCLDPARPLFGRAVVPVFRGDLVVGVSARSTHDPCPDCGLWHPAGECPPDRLAGLHAKWRHLPRGFHIGHHLYGAESALPAGRVLVVEGPGCVWRLAEAGLAAVAAFGAALTDAQQILLEVAGCREIYCGFDDDEAGEAGFEKLVKDMGKICRVRRLRPPGHDWGEAPAAECRRAAGGTGIKEFV